MVYDKRHAGWLDVGLAGMASAVLGFAIWQDFNPETLGFFAVFCGFAEIFVQLRWRLSITCPHCGFDPVVYRKDPSFASARVNEFLRLKREDPVTLLTGMPKLPALVKKRQAGGRTVAPELSSGAKS